MCSGSYLFTISTSSCEAVLCTFLLHSKKFKKGKVFPEHTTYCNNRLIMVFLPVLISNYKNESLLKCHNNNNNNNSLYFQRVTHLAKKKKANLP